MNYLNVTVLAGVMLLGVSCGRDVVRYEKHSAEQIDLLAAGYAGFSVERSPHSLSHDWESAFEVALGFHHLPVIPATHIESYRSRGLRVAIVRLDLLPLVQRSDGRLYASGRIWVVDSRDGMTVVQYALAHHFDLATIEEIRQGLALYPGSTAMSDSPQEVVMSHLIDRAIGQVARRSVPVRLK